MGASLAVLPRPLRNFIYDRVAQNRYRWFGRTESCMVPTPGVTARFVHDGPPAALPERPSPFALLLGEDFARLPAIIRRVHALSHSLRTAGRAEVSTAPGLPARLLCWFAGLPPPGSDIPVTVAFHPDGPLREFWQRQFGDRRYASTMRADDPRAPGLLVEHFGPFHLEFRLTPCGDGVAWLVESWRLARRAAAALDHTPHRVFGERRRRTLPVRHRRRIPADRARHPLSRLA